MDPSYGSHGPPAKLSPESMPLFSEGVHLVLSRWTALRLAVENEWGGRNSRQKFEQFVVDLVSWFTASNDILYIDELETMLDENMVLSFNAEIEDGSIEEVAEQLMTLHEECLQGNFESLFKLRSSSSRARGVSGSRQAVDDDGGDSSDECDTALDMPLDVDMQGTKAVGSSTIQPSLEMRIQNGVGSSGEDLNHASDMSLDNNVQDSKDAADGWTVISSKRNWGANIFRTIK